MNIVNLTPHDVSVVAGTEPTVTFPATGVVARVREVSGVETWTEVPQGLVPVRHMSYAAEIDDLPEPRPGVLYLVSRVTAAASARDDLVFLRKKCVTARDGSSVAARSAPSPASAGKGPECRSTGGFR